MNNPSKETVHASRTSRAMTRAQAGQQIGVTPRAWAAYERGERQMSARLWAAWQTATAPTTAVAALLDPRAQALVDRGPGKGDVSAAILWLYESAISGEINARARQIVELCEAFEARRARLLSMD
jgi:hypothetical protein